MDPTGELKMSRKFVQDAMFGSTTNVLDNIIIQKDDATSPDGVVQAPKGAILAIHYSGDASNKDVFVNTDGATAWTQIHNETA